MLPVLLIILVVMVMAALSVVTYRKMSYEYKMSEKRENKAISLMNKVKIKYINNTSTLEYLYNKYNIKSLRELEYLYDQYTIMVDEVRNFKRAAVILENSRTVCQSYCFLMVLRIRIYGLSRHLHLLIRERWLRLSIRLMSDDRSFENRSHIMRHSELTDLRILRSFLRRDPDLRDQVRKELDVYHIRM